MLFISCYSSVKIIFLKSTALGSFVDSVNSFIGHLFQLSHTGSVRKPHGYTLKGVDTNTIAQLQLNRLMILRNLVLTAHLCQPLNLYLNHKQHKYCHCKWHGHQQLFFFFLWKCKHWPGLNIERQTLIVSKKNKCFYIDTVRFFNIISCFSKT